MEPKFVEFSFENSNDKTYTKICTYLGMIKTLKRYFKSKHEVNVCYQGKIVRSVV